MYQIFQILFVFFLIVFIVFIALYARKVKELLTIKNQEKLKSKKYVRQSPLAVANFFLTMSFAFLMFSILQSQVPFEISIDATHRYFYRTDLLLAEDIFFTFAIVALSTSIYPILNNQRSVNDWFEFILGTIIGFGYSLLLIPTFVIGILLFISVIIFYMIGFGRPSTGYYGLIFGFFAMFPLIFYWHLGFVFWLAFSFGLGIVFGCAALYRSGIFIWSVPLILVVSQYLLNILYSYFVLLGVVFVLLTTHDPGKILKVLSAIALFAVFYLMMGFYPDTIKYVCTFVIIVILGQIITFELYKKAIRSVFKQWLPLIASSGDKIDLSRRESIPGFKKARVRKKSFFFAYLSHLLHKYLERMGFAIEIIEEESKQDTFIKDILMRLK